MMKEIKFRVWDKSFNKMINVTDINLKSKYLIGQMGENIVSYKFGDNELMQYTGLKDKNGIEIYEGDILKNDLNDEKGYVSFLKQEMGYVIIYSNRDEYLGHRNTGSAYDFDLRKKVIGNIYENKELLEEN